MTITAVKHPYEFLARWDKNGVLQGAHVGWRYVVTDGDQVTETLTPVEPVDVAGNGGFPLADILNKTSVDAISAANAAIAEKAEAQAATAAAEAEREAANQAKAAAEKERDDALAKLSAQDA